MCDPAGLVQPAPPAATSPQLRPRSSSRAGPRRSASREGPGNSRSAGPPISRGPSAAALLKTGSCSSRSHRTASSSSGPPPGSPAAWSGGSRARPKAWGWRILRTRRTSTHVRAPPASPVLMRITSPAPGSATQVVYRRNVLQHRRTMPDPGRIGELGGRPPASRCGSRVNPARVDKRALAPASTIGDQAVGRMPDRRPSRLAQTASRGSRLPHAALETAPFSCSRARQARLHGPPRPPRRTARHPSPRLCGGRHHRPAVVIRLRGLNG